MKNKRLCMTALAAFFGCFSHCVRQASRRHHQRQSDLRGHAGKSEDHRYVKGAELRPQYMQRR